MREFAQEMNYLVGLHPLDTFSNVCAYLEAIASRQTDVDVIANCLNIASALKFEVTRMQQEVA